MGDPSRRDVRETYDRIGGHFAKTRAHAWPAVERFVDRSDGVALGLDLGCGNARHAAVLADRADRVVGLDASRTVVEAARERREREGFPVDLCQGDATRLPIASETVGLAVYVATIHHLPTHEARIASLDELARVLAPGGRALVSAWSTTHDRFEKNEAFDTTVDWTLPGGETVSRYYHIYDPAAFADDLRESTLAADRIFEERGNCYGVVRAEGKRT